MKVQGRVKRILEARSGTSQRTGNEWHALPFILEYFESDDRRWADEMLLETFDTNVIAALKENMEVVCWVSHRTREHEGRVYNELRLNRIESLQKHLQQAANQPAQQANAAAVGNQSTQQAQGAQQAPFPPTVDQNGNQTQEGGNDNDDLPF